MKNLLQKLKLSNINIGNSQQVRAFLIGKTVEVIGNTGFNNQPNGNPHGIQLGKKFKLTQNFQYNSDGNLDYSSLCDPGIGMQNYVFLHNLKLIHNSTVNDFNDELVQLEIEEEIIKEKRKNIKEIIKFMQENEVGEFDEDVYTVFKTIKKCKASRSDIEKATEIAQLLKKK